MCRRSSGVSSNLCSSPALLLTAEPPHCTVQAAAVQENSMRRARCCAPLITAAATALSLVCLLAASLHRARAASMLSVSQPNGTGGPESLAYTPADSAQAPAVPAPGEGEVLIKVARAGVNRMDLLQSQGRYPVPPGASEILGVEVSGRVTALGPGVTDVSEGDAVAALLMGGGYAGYAVAHADMLIRVPEAGEGEEPDWTLMASIPEAFLTAYQLLFIEARVKEGDTVLMHAAASGVGQAAIQMAVRRGARVFATVRSAAKVERCIELGATAAFNLKEEGVEDADDFERRVREANDGKGVSVVLDPVGESYAEKNMAVLERDGRWVIYGLMGGRQMPADSDALATILGKRLHVIGTTLRARPHDYKLQLVTGFSEDFLQSVLSGEIRSDIDSVFPLERVQDAHTRVSENLSMGKVILSVQDTV